MDDSFASNAESIFSIFYDFFLTQEALSLLKSKCVQLLRVSADLEAWNSSPYARVVRFCSSFTLKELHRYCQAYIATDTTGPFKTRFRNEMENTRESNKDAFIRGRSAGPFFANATAVMTSIFQEYWKDGVMSTHSNDMTSATHVNPTFAHWSQGSGFVAHHSTFPPSAFFLAPTFASVQSSSETPAIVAIADIFQFVKDEFQRWGRAFHDVTRLQLVKGSIKIRFLAGDALHVCHTFRQLPSANFSVSAWNTETLTLDGGDCTVDAPYPLPTTYNVIDTYNLADHLGMLNVLIAVTPLLTRSPTSVLYTETLLEYGSNADETIAAFAHCLGADIATMSVLLSLTPITLLSEFDTYSNIQEVVPYQAMPGMGQFHERTIWKIPSFIDSPEISPGITFDPDLLARLLFNIYLKMFPWEDLSNRMREMYLGTGSSIERIHHSRLTLALFIQLIQRHVKTDWNQSIKNLLNLMSSGKTLLSGPQSVQDFSCHLDRLGLYSVTNFAPVDPAEVARLTKLSVKRLQIFDTVPPLICLILVVPRSKLDVLDDSELGNPSLHTVVRSDQFNNYFSPAQVTFGTTVSGETEDVSYIFSDPLGRSGSNPLVLSFWIPSWTLTLTTKAITVALAVGKTSQTSKLSSRLGQNMELFSTSFNDKEHVFLSKDLPRLDDKHDVPTSPVFSLYSSPPQTSVRAAVSTDSTTIQSFVVRVDVDDTDAKTQLAQKTAPIKVIQKSPCRVELILGTTLKKELAFPYPVNGKEAMLRIARTSSYIEVRPAGNTPNILPTNLCPLGSCTDCGFPKTWWHAIEQIPNNA